MARWREWLPNRSSGIVWTETSIQAEAVAGFFGLLLADLQRSVVGDP